MEGGKRRKGRCVAWEDKESANGIGAPSIGVRRRGVQILGFVVACLVLWLLGLYSRLDSAGDSM